MPSSRLFLALAGACALAQTPPDRDARIKLALSARPVSREDLLQFRSPALSSALESPAALWDFLTSPTTPYLDRRAAAVQAQDVFPVSFLPKLMAALGELREEETKDHWGLRSHPISAIAWDARRFRPPASHERTVLGHRWVTPEAMSDYPLTPEEEAKAPWPWQIHRALDDLLSVLRRHANRREWLDAALTMPCSTDQEAALFVEATQGQWSSTAVLGAWRNIALHPNFPTAAVLVTNDLGRASHAGHVILLDMLRENPHRDARHRAAWEVFRLRERSQPLPATAVLLLSRMALDTASGDPWTRLYVYAFSAARTLDQPPIDPNQRLDPNSPRVLELLAEFDKWFQANRQNLEHLAAQESKKLDQLRTELTTSRCSP